MDITYLYTIYQAHPQVATDTRSDLKGKIFFCLKGPNFDANDFATQALKKGAAHVVSDSATNSDKENITVVKDVLATLQELASFHRKKFSFPVIGLTGSNGKTTNKELIAAVLSKKYKTIATRGNLNNHIGVPLTLLEIPLNAEMAVIEMGANHQGEIRDLSAICDPDFGLIVNIGKAHLEGFGGMEGVKKGKSELYAHIKAKGGKLFVNADDPVVMELSEGIKRELYGIGENNFISGNLIQSQPFVQFQFKIRDNHSSGIQTELVGEYNFYNLMAAACIGSFFDVPMVEIKSALESYSPSNNRSQLKKSENNHIILDAYNANPSSMEVALQNLASAKQDKKIALLGQMLELGDDSHAEHQSIIELLRKLNLNAILVGKGFENCEHDGINHFDNAGLLKEYLKSNPLSGYLVLIKGSRMVAMETVVDIL